MLGGKYRRGLFLCILFLTVFLSGCMVMDSADLLSLPRLLPDHAELLKLVNEVTAGTRWTTATPQGGANRAPVQMVDLYNDGIPEAIIFLANAKDVQIKVLIYSKTGESRYKELASFTMSAVAFHRVEYADLNGDGMLEIIVGQSFGADSSYTATAYSLVNDEPVMVLPSAPYTSLYVYDIDGNDKSELLLLNHDESGFNAYAELFGVDESGISLYSKGRAPLSAGVRAPEKITAGSLNEDVRAVIIDGTSSLYSKFLSDVLVYSDENGLENASFSPIDNYSRVTERSLAIYASDVDFGGFLKIPIVVPMPRPQKVAVPPDFVVHWYAYDKALAMSPSCSTYHSPADRWYFLYPESWTGRVYTKTAESGGAKVTTFSIEYSGFQYDLMSIYAYPADQPVPPMAGRAALTQSNGLLLYATLPDEAKLKELPAEYRLSSLADVRNRFALRTIYGENVPLLSLFPTNSSYNDEPERDSR